MAAATREGASTMEGTKMTTGDANTSRTESPGPAKMVGAKKKKYRSKKLNKINAIIRGRKYSMKWIQES